MPWAPPPRIASGGKRPPSRPSMCAPISRSGATTRSMGRRAIDSSPDSTVSRVQAAAHPASSRIPVPELPTSTTPAGSCSRPGPPSTTTAPPGGRRRPSAPKARHGRQGVRGRPGRSTGPSGWDRPSARAASSRARWEMDLSPGTRSRPCTPTGGPDRASERASRAESAGPSSGTPRRAGRRGPGRWPRRRPPAPARPGRLRRCGRSRGRRC